MLGQAPLTAVTAGAGGAWGEGGRRSLTVQPGSLGSGSWSRLRARSSAITCSKSTWPFVTTLSRLSVLIFGQEIRGMGLFCSSTVL